MYHIGSKSRLGIGIGTIKVIDAVGAATALLYISGPFATIYQNNCIVSGSQKSNISLYVFATHFWILGSKNWYLFFLSIPQNVTSSSSIINP